MITLQLPEDAEPTIQLFTRHGNVPTGSSIPGTPTPGRITKFTFDVSSIPDGDYTVELTSPLGEFLLRKVGTLELVGDSWWEFETSNTVLVLENLESTFVPRGIFKFFNNEIRNHSIVLETGTFDGELMKFVLEKQDKTNIATVENISSITNIVNFSLPSIAIQTDLCFQWSLRKQSTGTVIIYGPAVQEYAAL